MKLTYSLAFAAMGSGPAKNAAEKSLVTSSSPTSTVWAASPTTMTIEVPVTAN